MKKQVLIADSSEKFYTELADILKERDELNPIGFAEDGEQAVQMVQQLKPDVLVLDLMLRKKDGISVLKAISGMSKKPIVLATSRFITDYVAKAVANLGARYLIPKPCDAQFVAERINDLLQHQNPPKGNDQPDNFHQITAMLHNIGVPANIKGYRYLRSAIMLAVEDMDRINTVTECIYKPVAMKYNTTSNRVQGAIRRAMEIAWDRGDLDTLFSYLGYTISNTKGKPTNSEVIAILADKIQLSNGRIL